jgi:ABC transport system ATP-binding/permease protein
VPPIPITGTILVGRGHGLVNVVLDHPTVDLRHAKFLLRGGQLIVADLRSTYGTFVDGERVRRERAVSRGSRVAIGPFVYVFDGTSLLPQITSDSTQLSLCCQRLSRVVTDRVTGAPLTLLHDITVAIRPRELVCLIGPSGSGKSTLLSVLAGRTRPDAGHVIVGGRNLHTEFDSIKHDIAVVPQKDALHNSLTVRQSLWFAAGLRLPSDTATSEVDRAVDNLLGEVGLVQRQAVRVRDLSGGQLKRISLANEIAHKPSLVFLDEVTSGLDELGDADMMELFRDLADKGRSVVCITHNTLNIERNAHLVVVLTTGGRLACIGTPAEVCKYFQVTRLGDAYSAMARQTPVEWEQRFRQHPMFKQYVVDRIPASMQQAVAAMPTGAFRQISMRRPISFSRQFRLLASRVAALQIMDIKSVLIAVGQAAFIGTMLAAVFGDLTESEDAVTDLMKRQNSVFLMLVSVFWLGCNNSAPEIVKERILFERERAVSVDQGVYYMAKLAVLSVVAIVQAFVVFGIVNFLCSLPAAEGAAGLISHSLTITAVAVLGTLTGLGISALSRTEEVAVRTVPIVLIPQIVLSDVIAPLSGWLDWIARGLVSTFWSFRAFTSGIEDYCRPGEDPPLWMPAMLMLAVHGAVAVVFALIGLRPPSGSDGR